MRQEPRDLCMWPFRKKTSSPDRLPIDGPWSVGKGQNDGKVMIVRANTGYREFGSLPGYEHQAGVAVPFRAPDPTGLPSSAENGQLNEIEDAIRDSMQEHAESLLVAIITTSGMREFVLYTRARNLCVGRPSCYRPVTRAGERGGRRLNCYQYSGSRCR